MATAACPKCLTGQLKELFSYYRCSYALCRNVFEKVGQGFVPIEVLRKSKTKTEIKKPNKL